MFILFGFRSRDRQIAILTLVCEVCGVTAAQALTKRTTKFTLFFIPLFPVRPGRHHLQCTHCGAVRPVTGQDAARLAA
ncbi:zinc-ribbon domain-containing protein [Actinoplanes sp. NPDC051346]|uniref:zinc-ribbon domain-containing protein n=1 Tax=Actinoplanes sp. NPDC051346 TaxID=3155048 RepID=UPI0034144B6F